MEPAFRRGDWGICHQLLPVAVWPGFYTALEVSMKLNLAFNKPLVFSFGKEKESEFSILTPFKTE